MKTVNKYTHKPTQLDVYIGRPSILANQWTHLPLSQTKARYQVATREESIQCYEQWLRSMVEKKDPAVMRALLALPEDANLVCYCAPLSCHGDVIIKVLGEIRNPEVSAGGEIRGFQGEYRFLSNFYPSPITMTGVTYPTVENAYQAAKTLNPEQRLRFVGIEPGEAKRLGRRVTLRPDWDSQKVKIMTNAVRAKFRRYPELLGQLLATGDRKLIEENTWGDTFWGVCNGQGENRLGKILMQVRSELR